MKNSVSKALDSITQRGNKIMKKYTNKSLNRIAFWARSGAPLNRKKSSFAGFFTTEARPLVKTALVSRTPLNPIAPSPPPPPYNI